MDYGVYDLYLKKIDPKNINHKSLDICVSALKSL